MKLKEIVNLLDAEVLCGQEKLDYEVNFAFGSDLMSDVLSLVNKDTILLTGLTNIQAVRTAEMMDIKCIIYVRGKRPDEQVIKLAQEKDICLISTNYILFNTCGILYVNGLKGAEINKCTMNI